MIGRRFWLEALSIGFLNQRIPPFCYFTLRDILNKSGNDSQVVTMRRAIPESPSVKRILQKQNPEGYWEEPTSPYLPKYKASYWQLMVLGQLGADKANEEIRNACH